MRQIKFRGLAISEIEGKKNFKPRLVYGSVRTTENGDYACISTFKNERGATFTYNIEPESVAMFVGYDKNGKEIYSDDTVVNVYGAEIPFVAVMISYEDIGKKFTDLRLKGVTKQYAI